MAKCNGYLKRKHTRKHYTASGFCNTYTLNEIHMHIYLWRGWGGGVAGCAGTFWLIKAGYDSNTFVFIGGYFNAGFFRQPFGFR